MDWSSVSWKLVLKRPLKHVKNWWKWLFRDILTLREKCPNKEFFLVLIFPHSDWIRRDTLYVFVFSPNAGKYRPEKNPYLDTFHIVQGSQIYWMISISQYLVKCNLILLWWNFEFVWTSCGRLRELKVPRIDKHFPPMSGNGFWRSFLNLVWLCYLFLVSL